MEQGTFENRVHNVYKDLTASEKQVIDYLRDEPEKILSFTLMQLAKQTEVSEPTVIRVCRHLGYSGYSEMKLTIAQESGQRTRGYGNITGDYKIHPGDDMKAISDKVIGHVAKALDEAGGLFSSEESERAAAAIIKANRIIFVGIGTSACTASDAFSRFLKLGLNCAVLTDAHLQLMVMANLTPGDVVVAFSHSGMTKDTVDVARTAHEKGATVICITNYTQSRIIEYADIKLITACYEMGFHSETMISRILQLIIVDVLYLGVLFQDLERFTQRIQNTNDVLDDRTY